MSDVRFSQVAGELAKRLKAAGWKRHKGNVFTVAISEEADAVAVADNGSGAGIALQVMMGVYRPDVERARDHVTGLPGGYAWPALMSRLGLLLPGSPGNPTVTNPSDVERVADEVAEQIVGPGLAWARAHATLPAMLDPLQPRPGGDYHYLERSVILTLLGDPVAGRAAITTAAERMPPGLERDEIPAHLARFDEWVAGLPH